MYFLNYFKLILAVVLYGNNAIRSHNEHSVMSLFLGVGEELDKKK